MRTLFRHVPLTLAPGLVALAMALPFAAAAQAEAATITVTGEASTAAAPDMATLSIGVTKVGETAAAALADNTAQMQAVIDRLKAAGIEPRDIQTTGLSINPNWSSHACSI